LIILVLIMTGAGLPLPEEVPILYAGFAASMGKLNPWMALASCFIGALLGDCVLYSIGYRFGHGLAMKHPRIAKLLHAERERRVEKWIERHGMKVLFVARFMLFVRAPVYLAVGIMRMPARRFVLIDTFCAAAVVGTFFGLSYTYGERVEPYIRDFEWHLTMVVLICVAALLLWTWRRGRTNGGSRRSIVDEIAPPDGSPPSAETSSKQEPPTQPPSNQPPLPQPPSNQAAAPETTSSGEEWRARV
jgi:membrane protein DedA with SNARE-associated domain